MDAREKSTEDFSHCQLANGLFITIKNHWNNTSDFVKIEHGCNAKV